MLYKYVKLLAGPLAAAALYLFADLEPGKPMVTAMAAVALWMAIWWLTEVVHLAVTSLLPFVLLPLLGIANSETVAFQYMDPIIFLFIGGFIIAFAIERWGLHQRIALRILSVVGSKPSNILLGIMFTAFIFSMWISNTATVMMLISAVMAVIVQVEKHVCDKDHCKSIASALLIGLAYSATIGGMATLVGTPTNMIFVRIYDANYENDVDISFISWFKLAFPIALVFVIFTFFLLKWMFIRKGSVMAIDRDYFSDEYRMMGKMSYEEKVVGVIFVITAALWFTRKEIDFGTFVMPGWGSLLGKSKEYIHDGTVAIFMALLLFLVPSKKEKGKALMGWDDASRLPFDIILLFGSGFALSKGFELSGLSGWLALKLKGIQGFSVPLIILGVCAVVCLISEFASNVASINLVLPILVPLQQVLDVHPLMLMIPATLAASLGFMLPVATAPNTIVFGSKRIRVRDMMKAGAVLDVAGIILIVAMMMIAGNFLFGPQ
jgi:solute carrier family 13 (sodium-dependent dicarboxylate transporter), member 2/3/5